MEENCLIPQIVCSTAYLRTCWLCWIGRFYMIAGLMLKRCLDHWLLLCCLNWSADIEYGAIPQCSLKKEQTLIPHARVKVKRIFGGILFNQNSKNTLVTLCRIFRLLTQWGKRLEHDTVGWWNHKNEKRFPNLEEIFDIIFHRNLYKICWQEYLTKTCI